MEASAAKSSEEADGEWIFGEAEPEVDEVLVHLPRDKDDIEAIHGIRLNDAQWRMFKYHFERSKAVHRWRQELIDIERDILESFMEVGSDSDGDSETGTVGGGDVD